MKSFIHLFSRLSLVFLFLFLAACGTPDPIDEIDPTGLQVGGLDDGSLLDWEETGGLAGNRKAFEEMVAVNTPQSPVYFAFDSYTVAPGEVGKIQEIANALLSNPTQAVILQGHTDERGSREYNLALGERRALAVRELLMTMGITTDRVQTLSMGEESPAVAGFDESAWSLNRRVQFQLMQ
ncbi:OmpA family protein [Kiritimatiellaeota bacterium B1221]|nr:OmpA family protein [Kiritimatiellaeota bacterium B1221]